MKILTVPSAKEENRRLQHFVDLLEDYEANTLEKWIIKEYAYTSSIREVAIRAVNKPENAIENAAKSVQPFVSIFTIKYKNGSVLYTEPFLISIFCILLN